MKNLQLINICLVVLVISCALLTSNFELTEMMKNHKKHHKKHHKKPSNEPSNKCVGFVRQGLPHCYGSGKDFDECCTGGPGSVPKCSAWRLIWGPDKTSNNRFITASPNMRRVACMRSPNCGYTDINGNVQCTPTNQNQ